MDYNNAEVPTSESLSIKTWYVPIKWLITREYLSHFLHLSALSSMVSEKSLLASDPPGSEWPCVYQMHRDHDRPDPYLSRNFTVSPCSSNATTLVNDDEHLRADIYKLILSPENPLSNDPDSPSADHQSPSFKSSFNPHATPFVPIPGSLSVSRTYPTVLSPIVQDKPTWLLSFLEGTTTRLPADQVLHAKCMLDSTKWTFSNICALAQKFSWQCATPNTYGPFARIVYDGFNDTYGSWESSCFRFHLQKSALEAFDYGWSTLACQNISPKAEEVDYASRVSCFVAELHAVGLLRRAHIHRCLGRVLNDMHLPEHIHVLWEMVVCGKGTPWQGPGSEQLVADFVHFFNQRTQSILSIASSGHPQLVSAGGQANSIPRMIREWHSQPPMGPVTMEQSIWAYPTS
ncbi:hypothetical protein J3A83DRAFT_66001 [Scleroderma citrinum]